MVDAVPIAVVFDVLYNSTADFATNFITVKLNKFTYLIFHRAPYRKPRNTLAHQHVYYSTTGFGHKPNKASVYRAYPSHTSCVTGYPLVGGTIVKYYFQIHHSQVYE